MRITAFLVFLTILGCSPKYDKVAAPEAKDVSVDREPSAELASEPTDESPAEPESELKESIETTAESTHAAIEVNSDNFATLVLGNERPVLVDFWAPWCGPCLQMSPVISEIAEEFSDRAVVCKLNVDQASDVAGLYKISAIPAFLVFKEGKVVERLIGTQSKSVLSGAIEENLQP